MNAVRQVPMRTDISELMSSWQDRTRSDREAIAEQLFPTLPDYIVQINSCEAAYVFNPSALPYANLEFTSLRDALLQEYDLKFKMPDLGRLQALQQFRVSQTPEELGQFLLSLSEPQLEFENGLIRMQDRRATKIQNVAFTREMVFVKVSGPTRAAEQVIYELVPLMWALAGVFRPWMEVCKAHQVATYGTGTRVRFPDRAYGFLSPRFLEVLGRLTKESKLGANMGRRDAINEWDAPSGSTVRFSLDELHMMIHRTEPTGNTETSRLRIGVDARHERGTGVMSVDSELPLDEHLQLVSEVISAIEKPSMK